MTRAQARFWRAARVVPAADGYAVHLDDKPLQTPAKAPLVAPTAAFAAALAAEWDALAPELRPQAWPAALPLTRAANAAIDRVAPAHAAVVEALAAYGETDLLCYRAKAPAALVARQAAAWDPPLDWADAELGARLEVVHGLMPRPQPAPSLAALGAAVAALDAFALTALHELVSLSGSLVLGLAVSRGAMEAARAHELSRLDQAWQEAQWGSDAEAEAATARQREALLRAGTMLALLRPDA